MHAPFYYFPKGVCQWCNMWSRMRRIFCKNQWLLYNVLCLVALSCPTLCDPLDCSLQAPLSMGVLQARILEWVAVPSLQGIFPTQELNPGPARCRQILYCPSHQGSPRILEQGACPFSKGSSWPMNRTRVSCIAGRSFTSWATREALLYSKRPHCDSLPVNLQEEMTKD